LVAANLQLKKEIEEHKRVDDELRKSREEFRLLVETMSEGLITCNEEGVVIYINDRFCEMLGRSREEIVGRPASECIDESSHEACDQLTAKVEAGLAVSDELKLKRQKGDAVWVKVSPSLRYDQDGNITGSFAVVTDISDRMRSEHTLRASESRLRQLSEQVMLAQEKERQRVAAELHDGIGQTLSAVKFSVETGISRICEQPSEESFRLLEGVVPKIQDAIEEVRRISMALRPSILDDIGILATLTWFCRESSLVYTDLRIQLQLDIKEEMIPVPVKVVIFRIVQEAFNNAVKHSNAELMRITLNHTDAIVELNIEDNGVGFDVRKVCANGKRVLGGLGLTSMRERAEYTGGIYSLESNQGKGTKIRVTWPV
jgi:PAS domain S-box-containing protein